MLVCPKCRTSYSSSATGACIRDGVRLVDHAAFVASQADPLRGRVIRGDYTLGARIGQGGMGTVYRAHQASLRRDVAVKILKPEHAGDPDTVARFQREATAMSLLAHPNTVRVFDFGQTEDGLLYLVMELLEGEQLTQVIARRGALTVPEALRTAQQILRSLSEAHAHGVVHRDLKPDNIFVTRVAGHATPVVKVLDFGIAKLLRGDVRVDAFETQAGTVFGTPRFMSPEQAQGAPLDNRSDLYSVGALLYQMLTGSAPFTDDDAVVVMAKHIREQPATPSAAAPERDIPGAVDAVVMRALAKDPRQRFQHAAEFEAALEVCAAEASGPRRALAGRAASRSLRVAVAVGLGAAAMAVIGFASYRELRTIESRNGWPAPSLAPTPGPRAEPLPTASSLAPEVSRAPDAPSPSGDPTGDARFDDGSSPGPAVVVLRTEPAGATVLRNGEAIGDTPMNLLVQPSEPYVSIELRAPGYEPLLAELTARDGERLLALKPSPGSRAAGTRGRAERVKRAPGAAPATEPSAPPAEPAPARAEPASPYQRFD